MSRLLLNWLALLKVRITRPELLLITILLILLWQQALAQSSSSQDGFMQPHNQARASVGVAPLAWDSQLAAYAQNYAAQRATQCDLVHSGGPYGENLFIGDAGKAWTGTDAVNMWVAEKQYYHYASNTCDPGQMCGHYTQVVWRQTTNVGCATQVCQNGGTFVICSYNPPGNYVDMQPYQSSN